MFPSGQAITTAAYVKPQESLAQQLLLLSPLLESIFLPLVEQVSLR